MQGPPKAHDPSPLHDLHFCQQLIPGVAHLKVPCVRLW